MRWSQHCLWADVLHAHVPVVHSSVLTCRHTGCIAVLTVALLCSGVCRRTLAAVHSGADLSAAIDGVLGYDAGECKGERCNAVQLLAWQL